jgi:hypothetical protein
MAAMPPQSSKDSRMMITAAAGQGKRVLALGGSGWANPFWTLSTFLVAATRPPHANERSQYTLNSRRVGDGKRELGDFRRIQHARIGKVAKCAA